MTRAFKKNDRVTHYKGGKYIILGISNQSSDRPDFPATVTYCLEDADRTDDSNWYSRTLAEFTEKFSFSRPKERLVHHEDGTIEVILGEFNSPNAMGAVYVSSLDEVQKFLAKRVGKDVGEMSFPNLTDITDVATHLKRIITVETANSSGLLADYEVIQHGNVDDRGNRAISVIGRIDPSPKLLDALDRGAIPSFGIRCLTKPKTPREGEPVINEIDSIVSFDIATECPRHYANA